MKFLIRILTRWLIKLFLLALACLCGYLLVTNYLYELATFDPSPAANGLIYIGGVALIFSIIT